MAYTREQKREYYRQWRAKNPERERESQKRYREKNPDKRRAASKRYRDRHKGTGKLWDERNADRRYESHASRRSKPQNRIHDLAMGAIRRAAKRGIDFDENLPRLLAAAPPSLCACCGLDFEYKISKDRKSYDRVPSIDRVDNARGYTSDNVSIICRRCNTVKGYGTAKEHEAIARYMRNFKSSQSPLTSATSARILSPGADNTLDVRRPTATDTLRLRTRSKALGRESVNTTAAR